MYSTCSAAPILFAALALAGPPESPSASQPALTIGDPAPPIDVAHWIKGVRLDRDRQVIPITEFGDGRVYVIEFWATWCRPCRYAIPHIAEVQSRFGDEVTIIALSDESLPPVVRFLVQEHEPGVLHYDRMRYIVGTDPGGAAQRDYLHAAGERAIPRTFIIGRDGRIEWIGHPLKMDEPLAAVIDGTWDRESFRQQWESRPPGQRIDLPFGEVSIDERERARIEREETVARVKAEYAALRMVPLESEAAIARNLRQHAQVINAENWTDEQRDAMIETTATFLWRLFMEDSIEPYMEWRRGMGDELIGREELARRHRGITGEEVPEGLTDEQIARRNWQARRMLAGADGVVTAMAAEAKGLYVRTSLIAVRQPHSPWPKELPAQFWLGPRSVGAAPMWNPAVSIESAMERSERVVMSEVGLILEFESGVRLPFKVRWFWDDRSALWRPAGASFSDTTDQRLPRLAF